MLGLPETKRKKNSSQLAGSSALTGALERLHNLIAWKHAPSHRNGALQDKAGKPTQNLADGPRQSTGKVKQKSVQHTPRSGI
jgi:hypothetical protein